jgi:hypothetical protein
MTRRLGHDITIVHRIERLIELLRRRPQGAFYIKSLTIEWPSAAAENCASATRGDIEPIWRGQADLADSK